MISQINGVFTLEPSQSFPINPPPTSGELAQFFFYIFNKEGKEKIQFKTFGGLAENNIAVWRTCHPVFYIFSMVLLNRKKHGR